MFYPDLLGEKQKPQNVKTSKTSKCPPIKSHADNFFALSGVSSHLAKSISSPKAWSLDNTAVDNMLDVLIFALHLPLYVHLR